VTVKLLLVDDEPHVTAGLKRNLHKRGYQIFTSNAAVDALDVLALHDIDVVISDQRMPGMSGADFLAEVCGRFPRTVRIMLSGQADLDSVVSAVNEGQIFRFLFKPCDNAELIAVIEQAIKHKELLDRSQWLLQEYRKQQAVIERLEKVPASVTQIEHDEDGAVLLAAEPLTLDQILEEMREEMKS